ncbi:MAG TPA: MgtC/SapB family protein [Candidatus Binatia bacterium]
MHDTSLIPADQLHVILRLLAAAAAGALVGWNRQITGKPAGLRTHMLVSLGAALFTLIPLLISEAHAADALSRAIQGVATGIGFLGAGEIFHETQSKPGVLPVQGLTSAAAIWVTAALGMVAGCGLWVLTAFGAILTLIILDVARRVEPHLKVRSGE